MGLDNCRVVLVRPEVAANIGATARVMRNMGLSRLVLVSPVADPLDREARRLSTHGEPILHRAQVHDTISAAVADCGLVVGTSAQVGGPFRRQSVGTPRDLLPRLAPTLASSPLALLFGPEPTGLSNADVAHCHYLLHIPTDPTYGALNLAQAVAICLYELRLAWLSGEHDRPQQIQVANVADQERMFERLRSALHAIHFLYGAKAGTLMYALRHLIGRAQPTATEVKILLGLARQIRWYVEQRGQTALPRDTLSGPKPADEL